VIGIDGHPVHAADIDDDAGAERKTGPVVPAAPHRQRQTAIARRSNGQLNVFGRPAVNDGARHGTHRLRPDRGRGGIAVSARQRDTAGQLRFDPAKHSFDLIRHWLYLRSDGTDFVISAAQRPMISDQLRTFAKGAPVRRWHSVQ
jgi:hypothetical protein